MMKATVKHTEFLVHKPTNQIGLVVGAHRETGAVYETIELANRRQLRAVRDEFRPASKLEIERHHRAAALVQPLWVPLCPEAHTPLWQQPAAALNGAELFLAE